MTLNTDGSSVAGGMWTVTQQVVAHTCSNNLEDMVDDSWEPDGQHYLRIIRAINDMISCLSLSVVLLVLDWAVLSLLTDRPMTNQPNDRWLTDRWLTDWWPMIDQLTDDRQTDRWPTDQPTYDRPLVCAVCSDQSRRRRHDSLDTMDQSSYMTAQSPDNTSSISAMSPPQMSPLPQSIDDELNRVLSEGLTFSDLALEFCQTQIPARQTAQVRPQVRPASYHLYLLKQLNDIVLLNKSSQSYGASLAKWDHPVLPSTRHKWTHPILTPARQATTRFIYPRGMEGWVDLGGSFFRN